MRPKGWRGESTRHGLAARGVRTGHVVGTFGWVDGALQFFNLYRGKLDGWVGPQKKVLEELGRQGWDFKRGSDIGGEFLLAVKDNMRIRLDPRDERGRYFTIGDFGVIRKKEIEKLKGIFSRPTGEGAMPGIAKASGRKRMTLLEQWQVTLSKLEGRKFKRLSDEIKARQKLVKIEEKLEKEALLG